LPSQFFILADLAESSRSLLEPYGPEPNQGHGRENDEGPEQRFQDEPLQTCAIIAPKQETQQRT
jgi:hypothetical protein